MFERLRCVPSLVILSALSLRASAAQEFRLFPSDVPPSHFFSDTRGGTGFRITGVQGSSAPMPWIAGPARAASPSQGAGDDADSPRPPLPTAASTRPTSAALLTSGVLAGAAVYSFSSGWRHGFQSFHFTQEHWFGPETYAGGADKCSHFVVSASLARELWTSYERHGFSSSQSTALAFGVTALSGLFVEMGDGISVYGFSWEDLASDVLGAGTGILLTRNNWNDLVGLRVGAVPSGVRESEGTETIGASYSKEIYSLDLKLAGLAGRVRRDPGPARFLLLSVTYNTKGFGHQPPLAYRTRDVGFEVGLNLPEILSAAGVPENTWWGSSLYRALRFFRLPYTSFGYRYDLNHRRWLGPDTGDRVK
jgi:uncharacterized protein YfiM (DUF2279 family)